MIGNNLLIYNNLIYVINQNINIIIENINGFKDKVVINKLNIIWKASKKWRIIEFG